MRKESVNEKNLVQVIELLRGSHKGITFINGKDDEYFLSYPDLYDKALNILYYFQSQGLKPGTQLIFQIEENLDFISIFWACVLGKIIPVPITVGSNYEHRLKVFNIWEILENPFLVSSQPNMDKLKQFGVENNWHEIFEQIKRKTIFLEEIKKNQGKGEKGEIHEALESDIVHIQFSSGSTGDPKGVVLTHKNLLTNIRAIIKGTKPPSGEDICLSWMPLTHDMGIVGFHLFPLMAGWSQYQMPTELFIRHPGLWLKKVSQHKVTMTVSPNFGYKYVLKYFERENYADLDFSSLRLLINGAEPISAQLCEEFLDKLAPFGLKRQAMFPVYGMAEASLAVSFSDPDKEIVVSHVDRNRLGVGQEVYYKNNKEPGSVSFVEVGLAVKDCFIRIVDEEGKYVGNDIVGHIHIKGEGVTSGYYNNPAATLGTIIEDGWLKTGDLGFRREGRLYITGRAKDIIFVNGQNYYPHDLERVAEAVEGIELGKIAAAGYYNEIRQEDELLFFILFKKKELQEFAPLANELKKNIVLQTGLKVSAVIPVKQIPKTTSGKVQRFRLIECYQEGKYRQMLEELEKIDSQLANTILEKPMQVQVLDRDRIVINIVNQLKEIVGYSIDASDLDKSLMQMGIESIKAPQLQKALESVFGLELPVSLLFDYPSIDKMADYIYRRLNKKECRGAEPISKTDVGSRLYAEPAAVIGMACRFPGGADTPEKFWKNLEQGLDAVGEIPTQRWDVDKYYDPTGEIEGKMHTKYGGFLHDIDKFDPVFFGITPVEASAMDPQQRILLEVSWEALEHAGLNIKQLVESRTGVYVGVSSHDYLEYTGSSAEEIGDYTFTGSMLSTAVGRISYVFGFQGPAVSIDTACSSSLVAVDQAITALRGGRCNLALAGGVNLILSPKGHIGFSRLKALSPDGRCKTFADTADGYGRSEGCGIVVLKRLGDALKDKDPILAVITGSAVNHDGRSSGLTVPNGLAQERVIIEALQNAGLQAGDVDYIEAHGSGTKLGDPQEINALANVFKNRPRGNKLLIGAVKTNIGHTESAAGIAGMIKVILSLQHGSIPKHLHFNTPNRFIDWDNIPLQVTGQSTPWEKAAEGAERDKTIKPRIAGVSSFGLSGTNAHIILQEAPNAREEQPPPVPGAAAVKCPERPYHLLTLSAHSPQALLDMAANYQEYLTRCNETIEDICYTSNLSRTGLAHRRAIAGQSKKDFSRKLSNYIANHKEPDEKNIKSDDLKKGIVFLFTGQGSIYPGMARELFETEPVFGEALEKCDRLFSRHIEVSVIKLLYSEGTSQESITMAQHSQPVIFSVEYALTKLWQSWGVEPSLVIGHSIGEYAAACTAGVFSLEDAVKLVAIRGQVMQAVKEPGRMVGVLAGEDKVKGLIEGYKDVSIAAVNGPENVTISGSSESIEKVLEKIKQAKIFIEPLIISHAFHSVLMGPYGERFKEKLAGVKFSPARVPVISTMTGRKAGEEISASDYWSGHICRTVRFYDSIKEAEREGYRVYIEIGGAATLCGLAIQCMSDDHALLLPSLRKGRNSYEQLFASLSQIYTNGINIDWKQFHQSFNRKKVVLPTYPFQRERYWKDSIKMEQSQNIILSSSPIKLDNELKIERAKSENMGMEKIISELKEMVNVISGLNPDQIGNDTSLFSLGLDSLMLVQFRRKINEKYGIDISINTFLMELTTLNKISEFIGNRIPEKKPEFSDRVEVINSTNNEIEQTSSLKETSANQLKTIFNGIEKELLPESNSIIERLMSQQIQAISDLMKQQLNTLNNLSQSRNTLNVTGVDSEQPITSENKKAVKAMHSPVNFRFMKFENDQFTPTQQAFVTQFIKRYNEKTRKSKQYAEKNRPVLSDWIVSLNFRMSLKELVYPIVSHRSEKSRFWDIDGNEYIDLSTGFGANYFGHKPKFIKEAVEKQLQEGYELGTQSPLAGEVASLICELTGVERVIFSNTGTEAVMAAIRIARAVTGRDKIVRFAGSYHGSFDGVLADTDENGAFPISPGTPDSMVKGVVVVLPYGSFESLKNIRELGEELAGVVVEPVQSRRPGFHPKEFLHQLRKITQEIGAAFILDDVYMGFRIHQGGSQAYFGIEADIVTYGKVIGGGFPIGVIAGKSQYLDAVDGGLWNYGDQSFPKKPPVFFAGTFCRHPLTMTAAKTALQYMKEQGPDLQERVNAKVSYLIETLNIFFEEEHVPIRIRHFGSLFLFESFGHYDLGFLPVEMDLFFYLLRDKGCYIWERRVCCFSTAHTDEDVEYIIEAVKSCIRELRSGGFSFYDEQAGGIAAKPKDSVEVEILHQRLAVSSPYPLSSAQKRIYFLCQLEGGEKPYHMLGALRIHGKLSIEKVRNIFSQLLERHECLRTGFGMHGDEIFQRIYDHSKADEKFTFTHLQITQDKIEEEIQKFIRPFNLSEAPLMRACLLEFSKDSYVLVMDFHHIIADGISLNIFSRDFVNLYQGKKLSSLDLRYRDYVAWEEKYINSEEIKKQEKYWLEKFSGELPQLNLPTDFPRPPAQTFEGRTVQLRIEKDITDQLKVLAREAAASLYMVLLSLYNILLFKISGQEDIIVGTPAAVREYDERGNFEFVMGMFTNTLAIRNYPGGKKSFQSFLTEVKFNCLQDYINQAYPFDMLVDKVGIKRDLSYNPLFNVMFVYENADDRVWKIEDLNFSSYNFELNYSSFDFILEMLEEENQTRLNFYYDTKLFKEETVKKWIAYYERIVEEILKDRRILLSDIEILTEAEKYKIITEFNNTASDYPVDKTIHELFEERARKNANNIAIVGKTQGTVRCALTYKALNRKANQLAYILRKKGITPDTIVAIMTERSIEMIVGILAILKSGGAYLPIAPELSPDRIILMMDDCQVSLLITQKDMYEKHRLTKLQVDSLQPQISDFNQLSFLGKNVAREILVMDAPGVEEKKRPGNLERINQPTDLAYVIFTSGSTGKPKGVEVEHNGVVNMLVFRKEEYLMDSTCTSLQLFTYAFDGFVASFFAPIISGAKVILPTEDEILNIEKIKKIILKNRVTHFVSVPGFYKVLVENSNREDFASLKMVTLAGDKLSHDLLELSKEKNESLEIVNEFGVTECSVLSTIYRNQQEDSIIKIGLPIWNTGIYILDNEEKVQPIGGGGELCIAGTGVARGYLNQPELTAEKFIPNPFVKADRMYKTGDLARWLPDGTLEYLGRNDHQVKIRGFRIELEEIEKQLLNHEDIEKAVVIAREDEMSKKYLCAYVVLASEKEINVSELKMFLSRKLPEYMIPPYFVRLDRIPINPNGKIDRKALPHPNVKSDEDYEAPRNIVEEKLAEIWSKILGTSKIGINDNFFLLGGDSIKSIQIASRMDREGYKVEIADIVKNPTISRLAPLAKESRRSHLIADQSIIVGEFSLTPIQQRFFIKDKIEKHHYNHTVLLKSEERLNEELIRAVFTKIQEHHDALRATYKEVNGEIKQSFHGVEYPFSLEVYDFCGKANDEELLESKANAIQSSINLGNGPLMKLGLFHLDDGSRLLIVIHHLVIDGISWRIIFEDLETLFQQHKNNEPLQLPLKTSSYKLWTEKLSEYANTGEFLQEKVYWAGVESASATITEIKRDFGNATCYIKDTQRVSFNLSVDDTEALLTKTNKAFNTEINDILITALGMSIQENYGINKLLISLEGHGREEIMGAIDISRTVGWFTSEYPVILDFSYNEDIPRQIKEVKETLHRIPNKGLGYGILKYLTSIENKEDIDFYLVPQISFNYLGQFDEDVSKMASFSIAKESTGNSVSLSQQQDCELSIEGVIINKRLNLSIAYSNKQYRGERILALLERYKTKLGDIISICSSKKKPELTPCDLTYRDLSIESLDQLNIKYDYGIEDILPLTPMQEGMLFHSLYDSSSAAYFEQISYRVEGELDKDVMRRSLNELFKRYALLRTSFIHEGFGQPLQVIIKNRTVEFLYEDISQLSSLEEKEQSIEAFKEKEKRKSFVLSKNVLMRIAVLQLDKSEYEIIWSLHHILIDGWSFGIFISDYFEIYNSILEKRRNQPPLPAVPPYRNFFQWLEKQDKNKSRFCWQEYLGGYEELSGISVLKSFKIKTAEPGEAQYGYRNEKFILTFDREKTSALNQLAGINSVTMNIIFQTIWGIILGRFNRTNDVVFGSVVSGRPPEIKGIESMVGLFINTIPVRIRFDGEHKFRELVTRVHLNGAENEKHHYYPLAQIQSNSSLKQNLLDHLLVFENYPLEEKITGLLDTTEGLNKKTELKISKFDIFEQTNYDFNIVINPGKVIELVFQYNSNIYNQEQVKRISHIFNLVVNQIITDDQLKIKEIEIISEQEKRQILCEFNDTDAAYPKDKTIQQLFEEQVKRTPDRAALVGPKLLLPTNSKSQNTNIEIQSSMDQKDTKQQNITLTYNELNVNSDRLANMLRQKGIVSDTIVGIMVSRSVEMIVGILGILKSGGAYLPIDPEYPQERIDYMLKDSDARFLLNNQLTIVNYHLLMSYCEGDRQVCFEKSATSLAYIIYTSGSTGKSKGALIEHRGIINFVYFHKKIFNNEDYLRATQVSSPGFDAMSFEIWPSLLRGAVLYVVPNEIRIDPRKIKEFLIIHKITASFQSTAFAMQLLDEEWPQDGVALRILWTAGDRLTRYPMHSYPFHFYNLYGPTEDTVWTTWMKIPVNPGVETFPPIGGPIANHCIYIMDGNLKLNPIGIAGEICISSVGTFRGYLNNPELTAERFIYHSPFTTHHGPIYKTGDLARWLQDGNIEFLGRIDHQVKIRGFRIELGEIESRLLKHEAIKEAAVIDRTTARANGSLYICAYIVPHAAIEAGDLNFRVIREFLSRQVPDYMIPTYFVKLEKIPLNANGKVNRNALPAPEGLEGISLRDDVGYIPPSSEVEKTLVEIWEKVLGRNNIGINDNFFLLGGDSIKSIQIASGMNSEGYKVEIADIVKNPTISQLAPLVKERGGRHLLADQSVITGEFPLTPIQQRFFIKDRIERHHYNHAMLLKSGERLDEEMVRAVFTKLQEHHDALRMTYRELNGEINQSCQGLDYPFSLEVYDFCGKIDAVELLEDKANDIQSSISLENGPLMKLGLFYLDDGSRLLIVVHHLVIDGISWRIIFEDTETLFQQYKKNEPLQLPLKTDSYKLWSEKLSEYANTGEFLQEKSYWAEVESRVIPGIKRDFACRECYVRDTQTLSFSLSEEETALLLIKANEAFGTEVNDILLTALGLGFEEVYGLDQLLIAQEGHGREEIIAGLDITRTVGWFTSEYPVIFDFSYNDDIPRQIKEVKETLHRIPSKGIGYGILKYLTRTENKEDIDFQLTPQIGFNYLGQFDEDVNRMTSFSMGKESPGNFSGLNRQQDYDLSINGMILDKRLNFSITFNIKQYRAETIERLLAGYKAKLCDIITLCSEKEEKEITPSDLSYNDLSIEELENFF